MKAYKAVGTGENNLSLDMLSKIKNNADVFSDYILYGDVKDFAFEKMLREIQEK